MLNALLAVLGVDLIVLVGFVALVLTANAGSCGSPAPSAVLCFQPRAGQHKSGCPQPVLPRPAALEVKPAAAFEAAYSWGWLVQLLEDYGSGPHMVHPLRCKAIASARLKNDKAGAAILAQLLRRTCCPKRGSRRSRSASSARSCGTRPAWSGWVSSYETGSTR